MVEFELQFTPPLDWDSLVKYLAMRTAGGAECINESSYIRSVEIGNGRGWLEAKLSPSGNAVLVYLSDGLAAYSPELLSRLRRVFDLDADPEAIVNHLGPLAVVRPGLRVAGAFDIFELAVRAILGQLVTVKGACTLMSRYVQTFGEPFEIPLKGISRLTPKSSTIAGKNIDVIAQKIGIPVTRAKAISSLARAVEDGTLNLGPTEDLESVISSLKLLPGVGDWTAHYIAMHGFSCSDAYPSADLALLKLLQVKSSSASTRVAAGWRPLRAYAVMHLWKSLED